MASSLLGSPIQQSISIHHEALFFGGVHSVTELLHDLDVTEVGHVGLGRVVDGEDGLDDEGREERQVLAAVLAVGGSAGGFDERVVVGELLEDGHGGEDVVGFARPTDLQIQTRVFTIPIRLDLWSQKDRSRVIGNAYAINPNSLETASKALFIPLSFFLTTRVQPP
ncbi:hypothetical protein VNO77_44284 [Canavalia gladiata]|uniref:Uncharacterized protein n=1 Tax=Canavalia gladiata TaxID=3824 RepID=A0AAN9PQ77_CANGL